MIDKNVKNNAVLSYGMVGGGEGAFIGDAHRKAINIDGRCRLAAGCFSRDYDNSLRTAESLGLDNSRVYRTFEDMAKAESERPDGIDFVVIVTPNASHYAVCKVFLEAGINVVCDKPLTFEVAEAEELKKLAEEKGLLFGVTYTYSGHVTAKTVRSLIADGEIGEIRMVMGEYPQGWLAGDTIEGKQAAWRTDPKLSGISNCMGDIGSHIENTVAYMTGLKIKRVLAKLDIIAKGRVLDDNGTVLVEYDNGASGCYWASQIAIGCDNALKVRIYGSKGAIEWDQELSENVIITRTDGIRNLIRRGYGCIGPAAGSYTRLPGGHSEGYLEAMANIYRNYSDCLIKKAQGKLEPKDIDFPTVDDGLNGVKFVHAIVESSAKGNVWVNI